MSRLVHYYHLYANGQWGEPWNDQITAIIDSGLYEQLDSIKVGVIGGRPQREAVIAAIKQFDKVEIVVEKPGGFEQETLEIMYADVHATDEEFYILYGHTKGAAYFRAINQWWRRDMIRNTVTRWQDAVALLDEGYDAVGIFWRRSPELGKRSPVLHHHFSGNFWWTKSSYVRTLGPLRRGSRYDAEAWIGYNPDIKQFDLYPGYPRVNGGNGNTNIGNKEIKRAFQNGQKMPFYVTTNVGGPYGKLKAGTTVFLTDGPYVQILLKSGAVVPWS